MASRCITQVHHVLLSHMATTVLLRHQVGLEVMILGLHTHYSRLVVVTYRPLLGAGKFRLNRRRLEVITTCLPFTIVEDRRRQHSLGLLERSVNQGNPCLRTRIFTRRICSRLIDHPSIDQVYLRVTVIVPIQVGFHLAYLFRLWEASMVLMCMPHLLPCGEDVALMSTPLDLQRNNPHIRIQSSCHRLLRCHRLADRSNVLNIGMQALMVS